MVFYSEESAIYLFRNYSLPGKNDENDLPKFFGR